MVSLRDQTIKALRDQVAELAKERDEAIALATAMKTASVIAIGERDAALGCDGNCACAVFASRHEAAMAGFKVQSERDEAREKAAQWEKACPQSSVCPQCGFQTVYRYPEPPGAGEMMLLKEINRLRALLREVEWIRVLDTAGDWYWTCPSCLVDRDVRGGHVSGCRLHDALEANHA